MDEGPVWREHVMGELACPACGTPFGQGDLDFAPLGEGGWIFDCLCRACRRRSFCIMTLREARAPGGHRDPPITMDDVLDAHRVLSRYRGDANGLFVRPAV